MTQTGRQGSRQRRLKSERQREIERGNVLLLNKMMKINERGGRWVESTHIQVQYYKVNSLIGSVIIIADPIV